MLIVKKSLNKYINQHCQKLICLHNYTTSLPHFQKECLDHDYYSNSEMRHITEKFKSFKTFLNNYLNKYNKIQLIVQNFN